MTLLRGTPVQYEPILKNRFLLEFPSELGIETWMVESVGGMGMTINPVPVEEMNSTTHVAGKVKFDTLSVKFKEHIGPSTSQKLMEWVRLHYEELTGREGYAAGYKKNLTLKRLDPTGVAVQKWLLVECMITDIKFDDNDLGDDALVMPTITLQPRYISLVY